MDSLYAHKKSWNIELWLPSHSMTGDQCSKFAYNFLFTADALDLMTDDQTCETWRRGQKDFFLEPHDFILVAYIQHFFTLLSALNIVLIVIIHSVRCSTRLLIHLYHTQVMKTVTNNGSYREYWYTQEIRVHHVVMCEVVTATNMS